jgi:hypothetical protein
MHLRLGGSFMRPRIIFSFRSSSLLLPISVQLESYRGRNPRSSFEKTEAELKELELIVSRVLVRNSCTENGWTVSEMRNLEERMGLDWTINNFFIFFYFFIRTQIDPAAYGKASSAHAAAETVTWMIEYFASHQK